MIDLFEAARELQSFCDRHGWRSCFIGGIAVQRWGEPRVTRDVDLTLLVGFGGEAAFVDALLDAYAGRIEGTREFAIRNRVVLLSSPGGVGIDISLSALPFEERLVGRATVHSFGPGLDIRTCSVEDLIVLKLFASRPRTFAMLKEWSYGTGAIWIGAISRINSVPLRKSSRSLESLTPWPTCAGFSHDPFCYATVTRRCDNMFRW
jgi:hypothetical protein